MADTITVIIPVRNRPEMLRRALESLQAQTAPEWRCLVVDDHSADTTPAVAKSLASQDTRISLLANQRRPGPQGARNTGIVEASSPWVLLLDSDCQLMPTYIATLTDAIKANPTADVFTNHTGIVRDGRHRATQRWTTEGDILVPLLTQQTYVDNNNALIRRQRLLDIGLLDERCPSFQEWDTHLRLAEHHVRYHTVPQELTLYHEHNQPRVSDGNNSIWDNGVYVLKKHRHLWLRNKQETMYNHLLFDAYCQAGQRPWHFRLRLFALIGRLSPRLAWQLLKAGKTPGKGNEYRP